MQGDVEALEALDRLLGIAPRCLGDDGENEASRSSQKSREQLQQEEDEMPLVCDVCGKMPDVEVSFLDRSTLAIKSRC